MANIIETQDRQPVDLEVSEKCTPINLAHDVSKLSPEKPENLPHVADKVPIQVWCLIFVCTAERFCFFGLREPFQNYLQNQANDPLRPGALGLGQSTASNLSYVFSFLLYTMPLLASVLIDSYLGRYNGLLIFFSIYIVGAFILLMTSIPQSLDAGAGLPGWVTAIILMSVGIGGVKAAMSPLIADQYTNFKDRILVASDGQRVLVTRDLTLDKIYHAYYWAVNIGALSALATTYIEKDCGFWAAYLMPLCTLCIAALTLLLCRNKIVTKPPSGNILPRAFRVVTVAMKSGFNMDAARLHHHTAPVDWDDNFVTDLQRGLIPCRIFTFYPILWVCHLQINNNMISQAAQMDTGGLPNDFFPTINPIAVLLLLPIISNGLYPLLRRLDVPFPPVNRMAVGFFIMAMAMAYCAGIQHWIYSSGPCFEYALECDASNNGRVPNSISVWVQTPTYVLDGLAEVFFDVVSQEYAYNKAPDNMKSIVQAVLSSMSGIGAVLGFALHPISRNPLLVWMYTALAVAMGSTAVIFWLSFRKYNKLDLELNRRDVPDEDTDADCLSGRSKEVDLEQATPQGL